METVHHDRVFTRRPFPWRRHSVSTAIRPTAMRPSRARRSAPWPFRGAIGAAVVVGSAVIGVVQFYKPAQRDHTTFAHLTSALMPAAERPNAMATPDAFGRSGEVKVRFALPNEAIEFPLAIAGRTDSLMYEW